MRKQLLFTVATPLFAFFAYAQQLPLPEGFGQSDTSVQQGQSTNCSDPAMFNSPQCAGQGTGLNRGTLPFPSTTGTPSSEMGRVPTYSDEMRRQNPTNARGQGIQFPPERLTEFQRFIASSTGQVLPIYGANLFENVPSTFAPLENAPVPPDYVVGPDDELRIRVWGQVNFNANVRVDRAGEVYLPQIGQVHVAGLRFEELTQHVHDAVARVYRNFQLQVDIGQIRSIQVYVTGEGRRPGVYTVSSLATLVDALFASGGPSVQGSMRGIELRRKGQLVTTLDLYALVVNGDKSKDTTLLSGDVIHIPPIGPQVALVGSVRRPAIYELAPGDTVDALLHDAGGVTALASQARASLERTVENSGRMAMEIRLDTAGLTTPMKDGDILHVLSLVSKFEKTVTLRGNTANPGRFGWHDGMKLSDLIPDRDALLTRDYWWKRAEMGLPAPEFQPVPSLSEMRQPSSPVDLRQPRYYPQQQRQETVGTTQTPGMVNPQTGRVTSSEDAYGYLTYPVTADQMGQGNAQPGATNSNAYGNNSQYPNNQQRQPVMQSSQSALAEDESQMNEPLTLHERPRNIVRLNVPEIDWSYAVIERIDPTTLKSTLVPFDLGKLVNEHDQAQDLALQPGDIVTVFSQSDIHVPIAEQTTFVRLEGEFIHAGTYSAQPGETLRSLVERAGGLTPNAYLYGSVFTRESTRILQQRRLDESVRELTMQMQRGLLALASSPASNAQDLASVNAAQTSEQALIAQLQQVRASGRIVLQFTPESQGAATVPDIKLENGDRFLIPSVPSTVNVMGAVFNQNSFVYRPNTEVAEFLNLAGGPNTNADKKREFIIRGNGSVISKTVVKGTWGDGFAHVKLYPGDTVVVPEKTIKPSALRGVIDWTQIFSQLALGAAAINVLR